MLVTGEKEKFTMRKKRADLNEPIGRMTRVDDFLPSPSELIPPEETIKITISLNKTSVDFFKQQARQHHTKYQKMIRELVDIYATQYSQSSR